MGYYTTDYTFFLYFSIDTFASIRMKVKRLFLDDYKESWTLSTQCWKLNETAEEKHYLAKEYNVNKRVIKLFQYNPSTTKNLTNMIAVFILRAQDSFAAPILSLSA